MTVVCNYVITTSLRHAKEKTNQRLARRRLLAAIENGGISEIENSISKWHKERLPTNDLDIENAQRKLDVLRFRKDIHDVKMRRNLDVTLRTIQQIQSSVYERIFRDKLRQLNRFAEHLRSLHGFTQELPNILQALGELNHTHATNELVMKTLHALLYLFGKGGRNIKNIEDVHAIAREMTHMVRIQKSNLIQPGNAKKAQEIIEMYSYEETRTVNVAAASVYQWIQSVVFTVTKSENEDGSDEA